MLEDETTPLDSSGESKTSRHIEVNVGDKNISTSPNDQRRKWMVCKIYMPIPHNFYSQTSMNINKQKSIQRISATFLRFSYLDRQSILGPSGLQTRSPPQKVVKAPRGGKTAW